MNISNALLAQFRRIKFEFWRRLITVDETWIQHYTPESKIQSKQWNANGEPAPKKAKTVFSAEKVMATVFWDNHTVILIDYLQKGKNHYRSILRIITWQAEDRNCGRTTTFSEKEIPVSPRQHTVSYLSCCYGENPRITVWTAWPFALVTRSSPKRLLFVPLSKN